MTFDEVIDLAKREYGLKEFGWLYGAHDPAGNCRHQMGQIRIHIIYRNKLNELIPILFHELGHLHCYKNGLWKGIHYHKTYPELTDVEKTLAYRTGLKAERWVDNWAGKEMAKHFPTLTYWYGYKDKKVVEWYKEAFLGRYYKV